MHLPPLRYQHDAGTLAVLTVDGSFGAPGRNLSHWPGNQTPIALKHELSTGIALNFVRQDAITQAQALEGLAWVVNNHFDTDGVLALFVLYHPKLALEYADRLLQWASAGDFFLVPNEEAFLADQRILQYADPGHSPVGAVHSKTLSDLERYAAATLALFERIPHWLRFGLGDEVEAVLPALERLRADQRQLASFPPVPLVHFDAMIWTLPDAESGLPGRHALFQASQCDRILVLAPVGQGIRARLLVSTFSWFDLPGRKALPRPDLQALALRLNWLEGVSDEAPHAWRWQNPLTASPELWFGAPCGELFRSHVDDLLTPSQLDGAVIKTEVLEALRAAWVFDNEDDTSDLEDIFTV